MIITKEIYVKITKNNKKNYIKKYPYININDILTIPVNQLSNQSNKKILVKCDKCGNEKILRYGKYNNNVKKNDIYLCRNCFINPFSKPEIKEKIKQTNIKKYGVEHPLQNEKIKEKFTNTMLEKYGVEHPLQNNKIKEKMILKIKNRSEHDTKLIGEKIKKSNIKKYGGDYLSKRREVFEKTMLEKYGVKNALENVDIINKMKEKINNRTDNDKKNILEKQKITNIKKYGVEHSLQSDKIKEKSRKTKRENSIKGFIKNHDGIINIDYDNNNICYNCDHHGIVSGITINLFYHRKRNETNLCPLCNNITKHSSDTEDSFFKFIESNYKKDIIRKTRSIINPFELDIYLPDLKLAFEFNGLYWHSELFKNKNYHLNKTNECLKNNIQLIHIYEDDWLNKKDIIKSMIINKLNKNKNNIYGRKCIIKEVDIKTSKALLEQNHIQGNINSKYKIGLYYKNKLVSIMTFGKKRIFMNSNSNNNEYEMLRFCSKINTTIIGGSSKLFQYFIKKYNPTKIISYADRSYSNGNIYNILKFNFISYTQPNYYYIINNNRQHRYNFRKDKLIKDGFNHNKTEHEIMIDRNIYRIYNSGNLKFEWIK